MCRDQRKLTSVETTQAEIDAIKAEVNKGAVDLEESMEMDRAKEELDAAAAKSAADFEAIDSGADEAAA